MKHIILGFKDVGISDLKFEGHYGIGFHNLDLHLHTVITSVNREGLLVLRAAIDRAIEQWDLDHKEGGLDLKGKIEEFNKYFTSGNAVDVDENVKVSRDEWRDIYSGIIKLLERSNERGAQ